MSNTHLSKDSPQWIRGNELFISADIYRDTVITCTFKLTCWATPILSSTLDMKRQELSKYQTATYHVHVTTARQSCSLWFILHRCGWQWPCEEYFHLTTIQRGPLQLYSYWLQTKLSLLSQGWHTLSMPQGVIACARRRILQRLSQTRWDSWTQLMSRKW